ncbi:MAG: leucyl aminopeptidase [Myxococcales bacterium]|nr:leucyl aminopeptidase [Myxococcales bacterium]MDH3485611.1 leucyl aminopeptidase [Myxococcales bacterium]
MKISLSAATLDKSIADIVAVAVPSAKTKFNKAIGRIEAVTGKGSIKPLAVDERFEGKASQTLKVAAGGRTKARWLLLVGIGDETDTEKVAWSLGHALASAARAQKTAAVELPKVTVKSVRAVSQGLIAGAYRYTEYKSDKKSSAGLTSALILEAPKAGRGLAAAIKTGRSLAESVNFARDLVNRPPNDLNPITLARAASSESRKLGLTCSVWNKSRIKKEGMNLLLAVNAGSAIEPRVIHVTYKPRGAKKKVAFVGKGLTFDAGGLCIKPAASMIDMKCDMAGAAATLGIVFAAARLKLPVEVHAVVGSTENMTGSQAYRPGDIYKSLQGKTVEVINTDAEGRLVLADVLTWTARKLKPDVMIDHATLTGACMVALGPWRAALYTDDDSLAKSYLAAADTEGEAFWRMPLDEDLKSKLKSPIADLKHIGGRYGGSITAALFLEEFIEEVKWMHLDIAGPAFLESAHGRLPKGGTGFGVATGVRFLENLK